MKYYYFARIYEGISILLICAIIFNLESWVELFIASMIACWIAMLNMERYKKTDDAKQRAAEMRKHEAEEIKKMLKEYMNDGK